MRGHKKTVTAQKRSALAHASLLVARRVWFGPSLPPLYSRRATNSTASRARPRSVLQRAQPSAGERELRGRFISASAIAAGKLPVLQSSAAARELCTLRAPPPSLPSARTVMMSPTTQSTNQPRAHQVMSDLSQRLPMVVDCGACASPRPPVVHHDAWQGMHATLRGWGSAACRRAAANAAPMPMRKQAASTRHSARWHPLTSANITDACDDLAATVTVSHPELFATAPAIDEHGVLRFALRDAAQVYLTCYTACVTFDVTWRRRRHLRPLVTTSMLLRVSRDPCGAQLTCRRSWFFSSQFDCFVGRVMSQVFSRFDGDVSWGLGQTIAFIGAAARQQNVSFKSYHGGDPGFDEPVKSNPAWDARMPTGSKLLGSTTFLPAPQNATDMRRQQSIGVHEYAVAWLAVQDSDFVHKFCNRGYRERFGCTAAEAPGGDAHSALRAHFAQDINSSTAKAICQPHVRRPASLAFNAQAYFLQVYAGANGKRSLRKDDHYIELEMRSWNKPRSEVPAAFVERLYRSLLWLERHHARLNITVVCVSVLTMQRYEHDPVGDERLNAATSRLQHAGVILLANSGNCRHWYRNCSGLPWPAIAPGFSPVGAATPYHDVFSTLRANKFTSDDVRDCREQVLAVCGAFVTSSALPWFASAVLLLREAIARHGFDWRQKGSTMQQAILAIAQETGRPLKRNAKANTCTNRRCLDLVRALDYVSGRGHNGTVASHV